MGPNIRNRDNTDEYKILQMIMTSSQELVLSQGHSRPSEPAPYYERATSTCSRHVRMGKRPTSGPVIRNE